MTVFEPIEDKIDLKVEDNQRYETADNRDYSEPETERYQSSDRLYFQVLDADGTHHALSTQCNATISDIINSLNTTNGEDFDLVVNGQTLPRNITLRDAGIKDNSKIRLVERQVNIIVRINCTRPVKINTLLSSTVADLKQQLYDIEQSRININHIIFQTKELENSKTLRSYNIRNNSELQAVSRCQGGY